MSKDKKDNIKSWWQKDEKDYNDQDKLEIFVDELGWDNLPEWKKKLFNNQINKYYKQKPKTEQKR